MRKKVGGSLRKNEAIKQTQYANDSLIVTNSFLRETYDGEITWWNIATKLLGRTEDNFPQGQPSYILTKYIPND